MARRSVFALLLLAACSRRSEPAPPAPKEVSSTTTLSAALPIAPEPAATVVVDAGRSLAGKKVLHIGDSMVGGNFGLTRALEGKLTAEGATLVRHTKVSETIVSFDKGPALKDFIRASDPDIVIITLGANDALVPYPEVFARNVQDIVKHVGDRECWWIGPPMWTKDTGIVAVIRENLGNTCRFFDSSKLELERTSDGIHPNDRGGAKWADAFWADFR